MKHLFRLQYLWSIIIGVTALLFSFYAFDDPTGVKWGLDEKLYMFQLLPIGQSIFKNLIFYGSILFFGIALSNIVTVYSLTRRRKWASTASLISSCILFVWIIFELLVFSFNPLSNFFLVISVLQGINACFLIFAEVRMRENIVFQ